MSGYSIGRRRSAVAAVVLMVGVLVWPGSAGADVDSVAGSAFGVSINSSVIGSVVATTPAGVAGSATEPANGYGPVTGTALSVILPGVLTTGLIEASTQGGDLAADNHFGFATSSASVANVNVGLNALTATAVSSTCRSNGDGSTGSTELVGATLAGNPLLEAPAPNTVVEVPGVLRAVLNEQIVSDVPGDTSIIVRAAHILLLPAPLSPLGAFGSLDIILAESRCNANGTNVNQTTTTSSTSTTATSTSTTSTTAPSTTSSSTTSSTSTSTSSSTTSSTTTSSSTTSTTAPTTTSSSTTSSSTTAPTTTSSSTTSTTAATTTSTSSTTSSSTTSSTRPSTSTSTTAPSTTTTAPPAPERLCPAALSPTDPLPAGYTNRIVGTEGNDRIFGTAGNDVIFGLGGNDEIYGMGGNDIIFGGAGNDRLLGGSFGDFDGTGDGDDTLCGGTDNDQLFGQGGNDGLYGEDGNDDLHGGNGDDFLAGGPGNDRMFGGLGTNVLNGGGGQNNCQDPPPVYSNC